MSFSSIEEVNNFLNGIPKFQSEGSAAANFDLSRFRAFCDAIGNPQDSFSSIHVAGTNGKGSTCRMLASVFRQAGYNTALYTSPHILTYNERFSLNGNLIPVGELIQFFNEHHWLVEEFRLTYFEISTALAFWWFSKHNPDVAIIETGLGGRLDATNVVTPLLSIMTSISLDHSDVLGDNLIQIAREKAGIIKEKIPVVTGDLPEVPRKEVRRIANQNNSRFVTIDALDAKMIQPGRYKLQPGRKEVVVQTDYAVPVQAKNMAVVLRAAEVLDSRYPGLKENVVKGIEEADLGYGHFERLRPDRQWYFDGAHNLEAVQALKSSVQAIGNVREATLVISLLKDKVTAPLIKEFSEFGNIYYYALNLERAATFDDIKKWLPQASSLPDHQYQSFLKEFDTELVIFAGSFYFYATVRDWLKALALNK